MLRLIVDEIARLQREPVSLRELRSAQDYLAGKFPLTIETPGAIATQVLDVLFYGLPLSDIETYRVRVNAITPDDIQRVARQYLHPDRLSVVLVGNASAFTGQLARRRLRPLRAGGVATARPVIGHLPAQTATGRRGRALAAGAGRVSTFGMATVMVSCGEASGDLYAGALAQALQARAPGTRVIGFGGERLAAAGAELAGDYRGHRRHRAHRSPARAAAHLRDVPPAGGPGQDRASRRLCRD